MTATPREHELTVALLEAVLALQEAWPLIHGSPMSETRRRAISAVLRKHGDFADLHRDPHGVYLSGPMTGLPEANFPAFNAEAARLRKLGHTVVNPAEICADPATPWEACMRADIKALCDCSTLALLPGWETSKGAHLELHIAHRLGLNVILAGSIQ